MSTLDQNDIDALLGQVKGEGEQANELLDLFENNVRWVKARLAQDPQYFAELAKEQHPDFLWIGCADSRVPANEIVGLEPGQLFVHRNIANLVVHTDVNCLSVLQYAVEVLRVKHIIVCGHYGCGGIKAAMTNQQMGFADNWLRNIKDIYRLYQLKLNVISDEHKRFDMLCELNVREQVKNVCHTNIVQNAWHRGQHLVVHGWIYNIQDGYVRALDVQISSRKQISRLYHLDPH